MHIPSSDSSYKLLVISKKSKYNIEENLLCYFQVVEAALLSRIQRLEKRLMDLEPRVSIKHREYIFYVVCSFLFLFLCTNQQLWWENFWSWLYTVCCFYFCMNVYVHKLCIYVSMDVFMYHVYIYVNMCIYVFILSFHKKNVYVLWLKIFAFHRTSFLVESMISSFPFVSGPSTAWGFAKPINCWHIRTTSHKQTNLGIVYGY